MIKFNPPYFVAALFLLILEISIAVFVRDRFVRPYLGDYLVVLLIYCALRAFLNISFWKIAFGTLLFAYSVEALQYFNILDKLGLAENKIARTVIGHGFEWWDMLAYTLGIATVIFIELFLKKKRSR